MNIAIFGGSFNPVHMGHYEIVHHLLQTRDFLRVIIVPTHQNPLKTAPPVIPDQIRLQMIENTFHEFGPVDISDVEVRSQSVSYSYKTLTHFKNKYPDDQLFLILGEDSFASFPQWAKIETILALSNILVFPRPDLRSSEIPVPFFHGFEKYVTWLDITIPNISATRIRDNDIDIVSENNWLHPSALMNWKAYKQTQL